LVVQQDTQVHLSTLPLLAGFAKSEVKMVTVRLDVRHGVASKAIIFGQVINLLHIKATSIKDLLDPAAAQQVMVLG
jgi:hypothetical protein